jgi:hypothetical protein
MPRSELIASDPSERLARLAEITNATIYLSSPSAKAYLRDEPFLQRGITVKWIDYNGYRDYPQCWGDFTPNVSIVDLLLNCGDFAIEYLNRSGGAVISTSEI